MTIEQKAKAYDEAKARMSRAFNSNRCTLGFMNEIFPELAMSEDEKIRKELISFLQSYDTLLTQKFIAWLEKQNSNVDNANKEYWRGYREGKQEILDKYAELEKQGEQETLCSKCKKEQPSHSCQDITALGRCAVEHEQKPTEWNEEDENTIKVLMNIIKKSEIIDSIIYTDSLKEKLYDWLKFLKERYTWKPSDEQMNALSVTVKHGQTDDPDALKKLLEQLKKLKE